MKIGGKFLSLFTKTLSVIFVILVSLYSVNKGNFNIESATATVIVGLFIAGSFFAVDLSKLIINYLENKK